MFSVKKITPFFYGQNQVAATAETLPRLDLICCGNNI